MLREASGPINFTMFLNMFGEKLSGECGPAHRSASAACALTWFQALRDPHVSPKNPNLQIP